jgi:hypothetical protein
MVIIITVPLVAARVKWAPTPHIDTEQSQQGKPDQHEAQQWQGHSPNRAIKSGGY